MISSEHNMRSLITLAVTAMHQKGEMKEKIMKVKFT